MATMNVSLPAAMKAWVEDQGRGGKYANSSDYVRDLIRRDREEREKLQRLQAAVEAGRGSGVSTRDVAQIMKDTKSKLDNGEL